MDPERLPRKDSGPVTIDDIEAAARRLNGIAARTPLLESHELNMRVGARVFMKLESLQRTGAFKFRGAYNSLASLSASQREAGVVAFSSGNHAIGIAAAARLVDCKATVVMPKNAPRRKLRAVERLGARIVHYEGNTDSREEIAAAIARETGATVIPSSDHEDVIAGQGTVALEIGEDLEQAGVLPEMLICPTGGAGLLAGCAIVARALWEGIAIYPVEPEGFDDVAVSLRSRRRVPHAGDMATICDGLVVRQPGAINFDIILGRVEPSLVVSDACVEAAMAFAHEELKLVVEPSGAAALAAVLSGQAPVAGKAVVLIITGGNVDFPAIARSVRSHQSA